EETHASFAVRQVRVVETQRGKYVDDAEIAGVAAIHGLDTDDGHDDLGRDAILPVRTLQCIGMRVPECHAAVYAYRFDETSAICLPVFRPVGRGGQHQLDCTVGIACIAKQCIQFAACKVVGGGHVL